MKEEKKNQIKELLDEAKKKVEQMKEEMPEESFEQSEAMLEQLSTLLEGKITKKMAVILFLKYILSILLVFLFGFLWIAMVCGYSRSILSTITVSKFFIIISSVTGIFVFLMRIMTIVTNNIRGNPLGFIIIFCLITILGIAFVDATWIHLGVSLDASLLLATVAWLGFIGLDLWLQKKIFF